MRIFRFLYETIDLVIAYFTRLLRPIFDRLTFSERVIVLVVWLISTGVYIQQIVDHARQAWTLAGMLGVSSIQETNDHRFGALFFLALLSFNFILVGSWHRYWKNRSRWLEIETAVAD